MTIAEKIIIDWNDRKPWALGDWGPEDLKDVIELVEIVAERGIEEACKKLEEDDSHEMAIKEDIHKNRWWEKEAK